MFGKLFKKKPPSSDPSERDSYGKIWLEALEARFGKVDEIKEIQSQDKPKIYVFYFNALPEEGCLTAITCGLSEAAHPDWKFGTPELMVSMKSQSKSWGMAAGHFASLFFAEKRFSYGDVFKFDNPISEEGAMNAYLLFAPSFLDKEKSKFVLPNRTVNLVGMYPIYDEEIEIYNRIGLKDFWHADGFEMYNPNRRRINV